MVHLQSLDLSDPWPACLDIFNAVRHTGEQRWTDKAILMGRGMTTTHDADKVTCEECRRQLAGIVERALCPHERRDGAGMCYACGAFT